MIYIVLCLFALLVIATAHAMKDQYLVVLRWPVGWFFLEMQADGRYVIIRPARVPAAAVRYGLVGVAGALQFVVDRVRGRTAQLPIVVHSR